jgi:glycosyltransferase involved in cell wall biosynthesis
MKKKIYIDGLGLVDGHFSGIGQYILGILRGLDDIIETKKYDGEVTPEIYVIIPRDEVSKFKKFHFKHIGCKPFPLPFRYMAALWHRGKLPPIDLWCGRGSYIFPRFVDMTLAFSKSSGLVIFDLSYELHREYSDEGNAHFLSDGVKRSVKRTRNVIAISQNGRREIIDFYKVKDSDVSVATPAADPHEFYRRSQKEINQVKQIYDIQGDYILALSNLEPRKNLAGLVDAYCRLPKELTNKTALLLVGVNGWKTEELFEKIRAKVDEGYNIIRPSSYIKDKHKPAIISGSKMLVYPSHYEGFGMPPLEALACGVPVIASDSSSLPEVIGKAGVMVSSKDQQALYEAMLDYLINIKERTQEALTRGPRQAEKFDWAKSAQVFLDAALEIKQ